MINLHESMGPGWDRGFIVSVQFKTKLSVLCTVIYVQCYWLAGPNAHVAQLFVF